MDDNIRDLIDRLYSYQTQALTDPDSLNLFDILLDCGEAANALGKACYYIDHLPILGGNLFLGGNLC